MDEATLTLLAGYYDTVPRASARAEQVGPFTLYVARFGWPFYSRPRLGLTEVVTARDVVRLRDRQRALGVPQAIEWVAETTPSAADAARAAGLAVAWHPLMVLERARFMPARAPAGAVVRSVDPDEDAFVTAHAVALVGFARPGTARGAEGATERDLAAGLTDGNTARMRRRRARAGLTRTVVAVTADGPAAVGSHRPVGALSEIVGVATLPAARRRGLAAAVTSALVADAHAVGVHTVFLAADGEDVARMYGRLGFRRVATACVAEPPV